MYDMGVYQGDRGLHDQEKRVSEIGETGQEASASTIPWDEISISDDSTEERNERYPQHESSYDFETSMHRRNHRHPFFNDNPHKNGPDFDHGSSPGFLNDRDEYDDVHQRLCSNNECDSSRYHGIDGFRPNYGEKNHEIHGSAADRADLSHFPALPSYSPQQHQPKEQGTKEEIECINNSVRCLMAPDHSR